MTIALKTKMLLDIARQLTEEDLPEPKKIELEAIWEQTTGEPAESLYEEC